MPPGISQTPHTHEMIREAMLVLEGKVIVAEIIADKKIEHKLETGDFVVYDPRSCHTMENRSNTQARTLTFKFLGEEKDSELFASDKLENCTGSIKIKTISNQATRYAPYVEVYKNLDKLIWQLPAFLVAVLALGFGFLGNFVTNAESVIPPLTSHNASVGIIFLLMGILYLVGVFAMSRIRKHHTLMGEKLKDLEPPDGYFHERETIVKRWYLSATVVIRIIFFIFGLVLLGIGIYDICGT